MVKFVIEVSEDYINEHADMNKLKEIAENTDGKNTLMSMMSCITFGECKKAIEEGKTEFVISPDKLDKKTVTIYDRLTDLATTLVTITKL
jgi:hypothetical protein